MGKHLTKEEYINKLSIANPNVELIGDFFGVSKKTMHRCKIDNFEWPAYPNLLLDGHGCPKCAGNLKLTSAEFSERVYSIHPNIEIIGEYINSDTQVLCKCKIDGYKWSAYPRVLFRGGGCPMCGRIKIGQALKKTHQQYVEEVNAINPNIRVVGTYTRDNEPLLHECLICSFQWSPVPSSILQGQGCPVCAGRKIGQPPEYRNSIWASEYKEFFEKFMTEEQMKTIMPHSGKPAIVTCPDCGRKKEVIPYNVEYYRSIRCTCGDGMSYPNKFMFNLLEQLHIDFISEYADDWTKRYRYDDFIPSFKCIIENHGRQHYEETQFTERTLEEEQANDSVKLSLALNNGIQHYIVIDCRRANMGWIKNSIMNSALPALLNFKESDIDWKQCDAFAQKNLAKEVCEYYNIHTNMLIQDIAKKFNLSRATIRGYLKIGTQHNWCNYKPIESFKHKGKILSGRNGPTAVALYCIDNRLVFGCQHEVEDVLNITGTSHIPDCCAGKRKTVGGYQFKYLYDQTRKDGTVIPGAITLGLITEEEALRQLNIST